MPSSTDDLENNRLDKLLMETIRPPARPMPSADEVEKYRREVEEARAKYPEEVTRQPKKLEPLITDWRGFGYYIRNPLPEPELLFCGKGWEMPDKSVHAVFAAGATGKTFLGFQLAACLATGINLGPFQTSRPFMPAKKKKVLYLCGEDPETQISQRSNFIFKYMPGLADRLPDLDTNLQINTLRGQSPILLAFGPQGNPVKTEVFDRLCLTLDKFKDVDVLVFDPLSQFFGLNENDNTHGTAWTDMLQALSVKYNIAVLYTHHESKSQNKSGDIQSSTGRGASSFRENARGAISMAKMTSDMARKYNYPKNWKKLVAVFPTKSNYVEEAEQIEFFERGPGGVLFPKNMIREQSDKLSAALFELLRQAATGQLLDENEEPVCCTSDGLTIRGLTRGPGSSAEKAIRAAMKEAGVSSLKDDINRLLLRLETENKITIDRAPDGGRANKQRIAVIGYDLPPETEAGDMEEEKQQTIRKRSVNRIFFC